MKNKKKYIILIAIGIISSFLIIKLPTYAKYVYNSVWDYYLESKGFYFTSDNLSSNNTVNSDSQWDGTSVYFNIKNSLNDSVATNYDINYTVTCSIAGDAASYAACLINGTESNTQNGVLSSSQTCSNTTGDGINVNSLNETDCKSQGYDWIYQQTIKDLYFDVVLTDTTYELQAVTVNVAINSTSPYVKQLNGSFILSKATSIDEIVMNYKEYSNYDRVVVSNYYSTNKNIKLRWNSDQILIDEDLSNFISYNLDANNYANEVEFNIDANKSLSYMFYRKNPDVNYTYNINIIEENGEEIYVIVLGSTEQPIPVPNAPALAGGMVPVKWDGSTWVDTTETDTEWYNYDIKQWANARTQDGSMWVWIPRYIYKITSGWHSSTTGTIEVQFTNGTNDNWNSSTIGNIDTGTTSNSSNNKWTNHPAFKFGNTELTGIWVAKFEASTLTTDRCYTSPSERYCNISTLPIQSFPNRSAWAYIDDGKAFAASRNMETNSIYGWNTASTLQSNGIFSMDTNNLDTHLIKNAEWGAATYLSKSKYGKENEEIWPNNTNYYVTGCAGDSVNPSVSLTCKYTYETSNGVQASTTGTIYGIYDMNGGIHEIAAAYLDIADTNLTTYASELINADSKYKNTYDGNTSNDSAANYLLSINKKGDAIYETSSDGIGSQLGWYQDYTKFPYTLAACFNRGMYSKVPNNSGPFAFTVFSCGGLAYTGFRTSIVVGNGL